MLDRSLRWEAFQPRHHFSRATLVDLGQMLLISLTQHGRYKTQEVGSVLAEEYELSGETTMLSNIQLTRTKGC